MNRTQYRTALRSIKDNGQRYTERHAQTEELRASLERLQTIGTQLDHLQERARWMQNPDTTQANIIKLTRPQ